MNEFTFPSFFAKFASDSGKTVWKQKIHNLLESSCQSVKSSFSHPTPLLYFKQNTGNTWLKGLYHDLWMCHDLDPTLFDHGQVYIIITHGVYPGELVICLQL